MEMEREFEERVEVKRKHPSFQDYPETPKGGRKKQKPPLLLRLLAWCGVILFCFVIGYVGTDYVVMNVLNLDNPWSKLGGPASGDMPTGDMGGGGMKLDMQKASFSVFYPKDGSLQTVTVEVIARTMEDNVQEAAQRVLKLSGVSDAVNVLHVFRDVDTVYLDFSTPFLTALNEAGESLSSLLITGMVRTMNDNFSLTKVRFLVDSKVVTSGAPVDLTMVWQLK
jgi:hypothetical protein